VAMTFQPHAYVASELSILLIRAVKVWPDMRTRPELDPKLLRETQIRPEPNWFRPKVDTNWLFSLQTCYFLVWSKSNFFQGRHEIDPFIKWVDPNPTCLQPYYWSFSHLAKSSKPTSLLFSSPRPQPTTVSSTCYWYCPLLA